MTTLTRTIKQHDKLEAFLSLKLKEINPEYVKMLNELLELERELTLEETDNG